MEAMKNLCVTHNICIICTLHQSNSDVLLCIDQLYLLTKGGNNIYCGPTNKMNKFFCKYIG